MPAVPSSVPAFHHQVIIIGAGAAGIATASSLLKRDPSLDIALIDPAEVHYYQPGWTMVGAGVFDARSTARPMSSVIPRAVRWIKSQVQGFDAQCRKVLLADGRAFTFEQLVVCPGLKLDWAAIEGLADTLGENGVTSNYRYDLAPYTWELVQGLKQGRAVFCQPPMPIKCAGAPQKALYLSCDHWLRQGRLGAVQASFFNAGNALFGVPAYVPALIAYIDKYSVDLNFGHRLIAVDGPKQQAVFAHTLADGTQHLRTEPFDMLHVVPPQVAPDFIRHSCLADGAGWVDVDPSTLRHRVFAHVHALGDVINASNAKTAAAARKQAPVVANNVLVALGRRTGLAHYDGYGSCPLTVERGKIVLAEFGYGGALKPSFPQWLLDGRKPTRLAWLLKARLLPPLYWQGMLKGREWLAKPVARTTEAAQ